MNLKLKLLNLYGKVRTLLYDGLTQKKCEVSLADLMLRRAEVTFGQLMAASRFIDIKAYCEKGDESFKYLNAISHAQYGKHHIDGTASNRAFIKLIESYKQNGYMESSLLTVDKFCNMIDGTHRIGANLYFGFDKLNANMVKRTSRSGMWQTPDQYFRTPLPTGVLDDIMKAYQELQERFVECGNTFCCWIKGQYENEQVSLVSDLKVLTNVLKVLSVEKSEKGILVQFSLPIPAYTVKAGKLFSKRAYQIETLLKKRKELSGLHCDIRVSKSCLEGKEIWETVSKR